MPVCVGGRESYFFQRETVVLWTESQISSVSKSLYLQKMFGCSGFCVLVLICYFLWEGECGLRFMKPLVSAYLEETCGQRR